MPQLFISILLNKLQVQVFWVLNVQVWGNIVLNVSAFKLQLFRDWRVSMIVKQYHESQCWFSIKYFFAIYTLQTFSLALVLCLQIFWQPYLMAKYPTKVCEVIAKKSRARVSMEGHCALLQNSPRIKNVRFFLNSQN